MEYSGLATVFFSLGLILSANARFSKDSACGVSKGCFSDCRTFDGCTYLVSWAQSSTGVDFTLKSELRSSSDQYIAVGFSSDQKMGEDSVTECVMTGGSTFNVYQSYNPDDDDNDPTTTPSQDLSAISGTYTNGILECSFKRANTSSDSQIYSLLSDWYLLWAIGDWEDSEMEEHEDYGISSKIVDLQSYEDVTEKSKPKIKAHGCLAIISWIGFTSIGVVLARYYKPMWVNTKIFGTPVWLQVHRGLLVAAVVLNLISVIVVWHGEFAIYGSPLQNGHPVIGMIVTVISILNVVGGFLRPGPKHKFRPVFKWSHIIVGMLSYVLGVFNIGIGLSTPDAHVPFEVIYAVIAFVIYQIALEVTLEVIDRQGKTMESKTGTFDPSAPGMKTISNSKFDLAMEEKGNSRATTPMPPPPIDSSEPYCGRLKNILLWIHIAVISCFTLGIMITLGAY